MVSCETLCDLNLHFPSCACILFCMFNLLIHRFCSSDNSPLFFAELISTQISIGSKRWRQRTAITNIPVSACQLSLNWPRALSAAALARAGAWGQVAGLFGKMEMGWMVEVKRCEGIWVAGGTGAIKAVRGWGQLGVGGHYSSPVPVMSPKDLRTTQCLISPSPSSKSCWNLWTLFSWDMAGSVVSRLELRANLLRGATVVFEAI